MNKQCTKCDKTKSNLDFNRDRSRKDGLQCWCKYCIKMWRDRNKTKISESQSEYQKNNKKKISKQKARYYENNREFLIENQKKHYKENRDYISEYKKQYRKKNSDKLYKKDKTYRINNREKISHKQKLYFTNNVNARIARNLRSRLGVALRKTQKTGSAVRDLGCSVEELKLYLEKQFYPHPETEEQMVWGNWAVNGWHIDHIIPLSSFDLSDRKQFLKACYYTNLQPLWAKENLRKSNRTIQ